MRILLTGGSGMVGRNILEHSAADQFEFLAPSSCSLDLLDKRAVNAYISANKPDLVIHAAGRVGGIQANMEDPIAFFVENTLMGIHLVNGAQQAGVKRCVNLASSCMYPRNALNPLTEDQILTGELESTNESYALAKIGTTRLCQYIQRSDDSATYITLVPCNLYGRHDKFDEARSHMIPAVIRKIHEAKQRGDKMVEIWGDGEARREFMYTADLADGLFTVIDAITSGADLPEIMNIGLGKDYSINEYYGAIAEVIGFEGNFVHDLSRPVGMRQKLVDSTRIRKMGWQPPTSLFEGIEKTYSYFLKEDNV